MNNPEIAHHITRLKKESFYVRGNAASALGEIGDASSVPALIAALKDNSEYICGKAAVALGKIGDTSVVPALIEALKDKDSDVRWSAAKALGQISDVVTLPRKILADTRFSAQERINILATLRHTHYKDEFRTLRYTFPDTRALCQAVLDEENLDARAGAQQVLNCLEGTILLRASQRDTAHEGQELLRAAQGSPFETQPDTLLRAAEESEDNAEEPSPPPTILQRLFGKCSVTTRELP